MSLVSICTTVKNRSNVLYTKELLLPQEVDRFLQIENVLQIVVNENPNNPNFTTIRDKFKKPFTYTTDCIDSLINCINTNIFFKDHKIELIIADWQSTDCDLISLLETKYKNTNLSIKVVTVKEEGFSRGRGLNIAANNATGDILFFIDVDLLFNNEYMLQETIKEAANKSVWPVCYKSTDPVFYSLYPEWAGYGVCAMPRGLFEKYGPWPEYRKWGKEDLDLYKRFLEAKEPIFRKPYPGYIHQWHSEKTRTKEYGY
jgi:glycosyltransferase involved in cell wall biosynthesis